MPVEYNVENPLREANDMQRKMQRNFRVKACFFPTVTNSSIITNAKIHQRKDRKTLTWLLNYTNKSVKIIGLGCISIAEPLNFFRISNSFLSFF